MVEDTIMTGIFSARAPYTSANPGLRCVSVVVLEVGGVGSTTCSMVPLHDSIRQNTANFRHVLLEYSTKRLNVQDEI